VAAQLKHQTKPERRIFAYFVCGIAMATFYLTESGTVAIAIAVACATTAKRAC